MVFLWFSHVPMGFPDIFLWISSFQLFSLPAWLHSGSDHGHPCAGSNASLGWMLAPQIPRRGAAGGPVRKCTKDLSWRDLSFSLVEESIQESYTGYLWIPPMVGFIVIFFCNFFFSLPNLNTWFGASSSCQLPVSHFWSLDTQHVHLVGGLEHLTYLSIQ